MNSEYFNEGNVVEYFNNKYLLISYIDESIEDIEKWLAVDDKGFLDEMYFPITISTKKIITI